MDFKRRFDYNDITNFLPDNFTVGSESYYANKFHNKMPEYVCKLLESESRVEYTEEEIKQKKDEIINEQKTEFLKLMQEYEERANQKDIEFKIPETTTILGNDMKEKLIIFDKDSLTYEI